MKIINREIINTIIIIIIIIIIVIGFLALYFILKKLLCFKCFSYLYCQHKCLRQFSDYLVLSILILWLLDLFEWSKWRQWNKWISCGLNAILAYINFRHIWLSVFYHWLHKNFVGCVSQRRYCQHYNTYTTIFVE